MPIPAWLAGRRLYAVLFAGAMVASVLAVWTYTTSDDVPAGYVETAGSVAAQINGYGAQNRESVIVFEDGDGHEVRFPSDSSGRAGDSFGVAYDPADPVGTAGTSDDRRGLLWYIPAALAGILGLAAIAVFTMTKELRIGDALPRPTRATRPGSAVHEARTTRASVDAPELARCSSNGRSRLP